MITSDDSHLSSQIGDVVLSDFKRCHGEYKTVFLDILGSLLLMFII